MKRYVLLENKEIVDRSKAQEFSVYDREPIKLQSDNLLDLLEVGDCYELRGGQIYSVDNDFELFQVSFHTEAPTTAIWKRNGDVMRRYEL